MDAVAAVALIRARAVSGREMEGRRARSLISKVTVRQGGVPMGLTPSSPPRSAIGCGYLLISPLTPEWKGLAERGY
jgi:hypothetical protein